MTLLPVFSSFFTPTETRIINLVLEKPRTREELIDILGGSRNGFSQHVNNAREKMHTIGANIRWRYPDDKKRSAELFFSDDDRRILTGVK